MITSLEDLHHAVDHHLATAGRIGAVEGLLGTYGSGSVALHQSRSEGGRRINITEAELDELELRTLGPDGDYVPLAKFDEEGAAALMARLIARGRFERALDNARLAIEELRGSLEPLHPADSEVAAAAYGKTDDVALPLSADLEWPGV